MKYILISLTLSLAVACGTAPEAIQGAATETSADLSAAALAPGPCITAPCDWNDLGPQPLHTNAVVMHSLSLNTFQGLPMVAYTATPPSFLSQDALVRVKSGPVWEAPTRLNDAGQGSDPALGQLGSLTTIPAIVAYAERRSGTDAVIRLKTRSVVNGASVWNPFDPQSDTGLSAISTPGSGASSPSVVVTPNFTFVAWAEFSPANKQIEVFVQSYRNGVWTNLGTQPDGSMDAGSLPKLSINANNRMALAYEQGGVSAPRLVVRKWNGSAFAPLPDPSPSSVAFGNVSVGVASTGDPVVAFSESRGGQGATLIVRQRTGHGTWVTLGPPLNINPAASAVHPSLVVSGSQISVAWTEISSNTLSSAHLKRWNPGAQTWDAVGGQINADQFAEDISLAVGSAGNPLAALSLSTPPNFNPIELRVRAF